MNPYISTMGPAIGFVLGIFFTWFLMYSKIKTVERNSEIESKKQAEEIDSLKTVKEELSSANARVEERKKALEALEKQVAGLKQYETEAISLREKVQSVQQQVADLNRQLENERKNCSELQNELKSKNEKIDQLNEKVGSFSATKERMRSLEQENASLLKENEQLHNIENHLKQIDEIKEMYSQSLEEGEILRDEQMVRHFTDIKDGLRQSIQAYNRMLGMIDNPLLADSRIIEIDLDNTARVKPANGLDKTVEEDLDELENDTEDLKKLDGEIDE